MSDSTVFQNHHYKMAWIAMRQIEALLEAIEQSGMEMDAGAVLAAIGGIQVIASKMSESLDRIGDIEVAHG